MSEFPGSFQAATTPLSKTMAGPAAEAFDELAAAGYEVHVGLTADLADSIAAMALEPDIREYCPRDCVERFADRAATERWLSKKRAAFLLLKKNGDGSLSLAGYGWVGGETSRYVPGGETTFALRIGQASQGHGLATPFARLILAAAVSLYGARKIWLETWSSNGAAVHIYHKLGFVDVDQQADERVTGEGRRVPDTRLYMSLPDA